MQMLFQMEMGKQTPDEVLKTFWQAADKTDAETRGFADDLFRVAIANQEKIDNLITAHSKHWRLERMAAVDRNLLRMSVGEMLGYRGTPFPVVINEALEIARRYSAPESTQFLNGMLDAVAKEILDSRG
ncbi:MAG: transcription antitermination factor NusB [Acidobacteriota bacterium]|nr:transcription antitermination factor NusB [Acidobacteriota bacterium]